MKQLLLIFLSLIWSAFFMTNVTSMFVRGKDISNIFNWLQSTVTGKDKASAVCYEPLGCFRLDGSWFSALLRPTPAPQSPENIGTNIYYFNRNKKEDGLLVYEDLKLSMIDTGFSADREQTFFIVHGYLASGNSSWMTTLKDTLLEKVDANVFIVDWGKGANKINYFQVASNTRIVGAELGRVIGNLIKENLLKPSSVHLIGHSLGAQISSYAAKNVTGIYRVTGLDAAQPAFEGLPKEVRIDKSDATFVDLLHTNIRPTVPTLGFGMISAVGHVDIYMNGGLDQPGCYTPDGVNNIKSFTDITKIPFSVLATWLSCSHGKAYEYFTASLTAKCKMWARKSGTIRNLVNAVTLGNVEPITAVVDKCSEETCTVIGLDTPNYKARGTFATTTVRQYPYCDMSDPSFDKEVQRQISSNEGSKNIGSQLIKVLRF